MGKLSLLAIALLALAPIASAGRGSPLSPQLQKELSREERIFVEEFRELEEAYNYCNFQSEEAYTEFYDDLNNINARRRSAYTKRRQSPPPDFSCSGGSGA